MNLPPQWNQQGAALYTRLGQLVTRERDHLEKLRQIREEIEQTHQQIDHLVATAGLASEAVAATAAKDAAHAAGVVPIDQGKEQR